MNTPASGKSLLKIGMPVTLGLLITQIQQITDQMFLGHASAEYLSAVGNAMFTIWTTISFLFALGTGTAILVSQSLGAKNKDRAEELLGSSLVWSSLLSFVVFGIWTLFNRNIFILMGVKEPVLSYAVTYTGIYSFGVLISGLTASANAVFNGSGATKSLMISSLVRGLVNAGLDWILIFGHFGFPALGIAGAAIATLTADIVGGAYSLWAAFNPKLPISLSPRVIAKAKFGTYVDIIKTGLPTGLEEFAWNFGNILLIRILNGIDPLATGIYTIVMSITLVPTLIFMGLGSASTTITGHRYGEGRHDLIRPVIRNALMLCSILSVVAVFLFGFFPTFFASLFTKDASVIRQIPPMLLVYSLALFPKAGNIIYGGGIRGMGDTKWMLLTQIFGTVFMLAVAQFMTGSLHLAIVGVFTAMFLDELVRSIMNGAKFYSKFPRPVVQCAEDRRRTA